MSRVQGIVITGLVLLVLATLLYLTIGDLSDRETGLLSLLLFVFSVTATWLIGHAYAQYSHQKTIGEVKEEHRASLRTYGLNAAEKVTNLSNQLARLSTYLQDGLDSSDFDSEKELLRTREERLETAVHILGTLKSVNDTTLSDWKGVIGDELEEQREEREEREEEVRELIERMQQMEASWAIFRDIGVSGLDREAAVLRDEVEAIRREMRRLLSSVVGTPVKAAKKKRIKRDVEMTCPECRASLTYRQKARRSSFKVITCQSCGNEFVSRYSPEQDAFSLQLKVDRPESIKCPGCTADLTVELGVIPGQSARITCEKCAREIQVSRAAEEMRVKLVPPAGASPVKKLIFDETVELVRQFLPAQPWPRGIHKRAAAELGLPVSQVQRAIRELIRRGDFKQQIDGKLYELVEVTSGEAEPAGREAPATDGSG